MCKDTGQVISIACPGKWGFPGGASGKVPACQCRRDKRHGFDPRAGKSGWVSTRHAEGGDLPPPREPVFLKPFSTELGKDHGGLSLPLSTALPPTPQRRTLGLTKKVQSAETENEARGTTGSQSEALYVLCVERTQN